jgi:hypothetical protein
MQNSKTNSANSAKVNLDTPQDCNPPHTRATQRRKIDAAVLAEMAQAVARMLTESEAARLCGIDPKSWFQWKSRARCGQKFAALLEKCRAARIQGLIARVEKSADGVDVKYPEFRAALALLKHIDQRRFGDSPAVEINVPTLTVDESQLARLRLVYEAAQSQQLAEAAAPAALPPPARVLELEPAKQP